jgi:hypothetical protein
MGVPECSTPSASSTCSLSFVHIRVQVSLIYSLPIPNSEDNSSDSDTDSSSSSGSSHKKGASRFLMGSSESESEDERRVVRSAKDKAHEELLTTCTDIRVCCNLAVCLASARGNCAKIIIISKIISPASWQQRLACRAVAAIFHCRIRCTSTIGLQFKLCLIN